MNWAMDELQARASAQLGRLQDFSEQLADIRVRETDNDDVVTVEIDGNGALTGLWLSDGANELGGIRLGERIVSTALLGAQRAFAKRAAITEEFTESFAELVQSRSDD